MTPFIIYADFESLLCKLDISQKNESSSYAYEKHEAFMVGCYLHSMYEDKLYSSYWSYEGVDCAKVFVEKLVEYATNVKPIFDKILPMMKLTKEEELRHETENCHICERPFSGGEVRVHDHCHITSKYRGPAHDACNLNYKIRRVIPVVFHNLSGYDMHFVIRELIKLDGYLSVLPITKEKYISVSMKLHEEIIELRFIDSFRFLNSSLDKLVSYLDKSDMKILRKQNAHLNVEDFELLTRKGVLPYEYLDDWKKLDEFKLPDKREFYSKLRGAHITDADYEHAKKVWSTFNMKTMREYVKRYLETDVLALADVFEKFRQSSKFYYKLDPALYYTAPGYTWDAMLLSTGITFELLDDIDMLLFIESGIRGGLSQASNRYSHANNKYMHDYDASKPSTYLMYYDVNNLYGWAMSQYLPYGGFEWTSTNIDVTTVPDDSDIGYILEVDLEYPKILHDHHVDLPFCPVHEAPPFAKDKKLLATLNNKEKYVIHYRNLKQCIAFGLKLTEIHRVIQFKQSAWLKPYIELNTRLRTQATNEFEKNLFKLMINAVFGKTMENVRKHVDVKLVNKWGGRFGAEALISRPNFHSRTIFEENFMAIELRRLNVKIFKPVYVGFAILDISKTCVYDFHYGYMKAVLNKGCKLMYTDTDSLLYELTCEDAYSLIKRDIDRFDTSDYPENNVYGIPRRNKKVPAKMKDENNGAIMTHFVALCAKMYALRVQDRDKDIKKSKGVVSSVVENDIEFNQYRDCLFTGEDVRCSQRRIQSKLHHVYTVCESKIALSSFDDKRCLLKNSTDTLPWGHYKINLDEYEPPVKRCRK